MKKNREAQFHELKGKYTFFLILVCALISAAIVCFLLYRYDHTFTADRWNKAMESRDKMVKDLLEKHQLIGMFESDVLALLGGEDSQQSSFKINRKEFPPETTLVYYLGLDYMDSKWLILSLKNGIVYDFCIDVS